jgi:glucose-6-phosphate isomerase
MANQFSDQAAYGRMISEGNPLLYEVYEFAADEIPGELLSGVSIVHHGRVGNEYYMTKGHFHTIVETAETYYCLAGRGIMIMETPEGTTAVKEIRPGVMLYVPPRWAHRSVNVDDSADLVTLFSYPAHAGHDYGTIETRGFHKIVVDRGSGPEIVDNPRWRTPD